MAKIALLGAGGKMGCRIADNLLKTEHDVAHVEISEVGRNRLRDRGIGVVEAAVAVQDADVVILAVPDNRIGSVAETTVPVMRSGATLIVLDAAAPYAGHLPNRADVSYVACHPCHPSVFNEEADPLARQDHFGGVAAKQNVVCALIQGADTDYARAADVVAAMFAPVIQVYRVTLENMILLEPVLSETTAATCVTVIREAMDEAVKRGVPAAAARAFILGHLNVELAIIFEEIDSPFSDGALKAIASARSQIFRADWKSVFEPANVRDSVAAIVAS